MITRSPPLRAAFSHRAFRNREAVCRASRLRRPMSTFSHRAFRNREAGKFMVTLLGLRCLSVIALSGIVRR